MYRQSFQQKMRELGYLQYDDDAETFEVRGRGELQLAVLIEQMREQIQNIE